MPTVNCEFCNEKIVIGVQVCPHCGRPSLFPNVLLANMPEEIDALTLRFEQQKLHSKNTGNEAALDELSFCVSSSTACKGMPRWELERLLASDTATGATYYEQIAGNARIPDDNRWDRLRRIADASFFQCFGSKINFAALSTAGNWLQSYGDGAIFFKETMIGYRSTVFEQNTATWVDENNGDLTIPYGFRASWPNRDKLAIAKLGEKAQDGCADFDSLLLSCGATSGDDEFMEVHIYGGFTIRSAESIIVKKGSISEIGRLDILDRMNKLGISFSELT